LLGSGLVDEKILFRRRGKEGLYAASIVFPYP
jgi:hypothetical protein